MAKIYRASWYDEDGSCDLSWHSSKTKARRACAEAPGGAPKQVFAYDITTTKAGILDWLNRHFITDNG